MKYLIPQVRSLNCLMLASGCTSIGRLLVRLTYDAVTGSARQRRSRGRRRPCRATNTLTMLFQAVFQLLLLVSCVSIPGVFLGIWGYHVHP